MTPTEASEDLNARLWAALRAQRLCMLALEGSPREGMQAAPRPMTALLEHDAPMAHPVVWFFSAKGTEIVEDIAAHEMPNAPATLTFTSEGHGLFATLRGALSLCDDPARIDALWSPMIAAWYEGRDDPKLALLRLDVADAEIWDAELSLAEGVRLLFGSDPARDYAQKHAKLSY